MLKKGKKKAKNQHLKQNLKKPQNAWGQNSVREHKQTNFSKMWMIDFVHNMVQIGPEIMPTVKSLATWD